MTDKNFYCDRTGAPSNERSRCGLFSYESAIELARQWADKDGAEVHVVRSNGSGQIEMHVTTLHPRNPSKLNSKQKERRMKKIIRFGSGPDGDVFCKIKIENGKLSISGVEGPQANGHARGGAGQIEMHMDAEYIQRIEPAPGWDADKIGQFVEMWKRWHLNDMRAGCEHQRAEGWDKRPIDPNKPTNAYGKHFEGQRQDSWNMLAWIRPDEHPAGLLGKACPTCGYRYGTAWKREELPQEVADFMAALPDTDKAPAWV